MFIFYHTLCYGTWDDLVNNLVNTPNFFFFATENLQKTVAAHPFPDYKSNQSLSAILKSREIFENDHVHKTHVCCIKTNATLYFVFLSGMKCWVKLWFEQYTFSYLNLCPMSLYELNVQFLIFIWEDGIRQTGRAMWLFKPHVTMESQGQH